MNQRQTFPCTVCGADVLEGKNFCRSCGASESDGWSGEEGSEDADFDYDEYAEREFGIRSPGTKSQDSKRAAKGWIIWLLIAAFVLSLLGPLLLFS